ncbi:MAG: hypothetical protein KAU28_03110 [Phycisphaerae bacterium]|nr:hypothetical protein [Phycisphaerae bacterium]
MVTVEQLWPKAGSTRPWAVPFRLIGVISATGDTELLSPHVLGRAFQVINWWIISQDTTASNVKLKKGAVDICPVLTVKGTVNDAIVAGASLDLALSTFGLPTDKLYVNQSGTTAFTVICECIWTEG